MSSINEFKVSVIIPIFNAEKYIEEAVKSALNLPETGEVILIDDASSDNSFKICKDLVRIYPDKVSLLIHNNGINKGPAATRNLGIRNATYQYISFLDADDYYLPNRFLVDKKIFLNYNEVDGVYGCNQAIFENESVKVKFLSRYESDRMTIKEKLLKEKLFTALLFGGHGRWHTSAITLRKEVFNKVDFFNEKLRMAEDTELWLKLSLKSNLLAGSIAEPVSIRRVHDTNSIHQLDKVHKYANEMYQSIFDWSLKESLDFSVKNSFFIALYQFVKGANYDVRKLFWEQFRRNKLMIFQKFFYKKIYQLYFIKL